MCFLKTLININNVNFIVVLGACFTFIIFNNYCLKVVVEEYFYNFQANLLKKQKKQNFIVTTVNLPVQLVHVLSVR